MCICNVSACGRVPYAAGFGIGVVAVSGDHRSGFGLGFGLGIGVATVLRDQRCIGFPSAGPSRKSPQFFNCPEPESSYRGSAGVPLQYRRSPKGYSWCSPRREEGVTMNENRLPPCGVIR